MINSIIFHSHYSLTYINTINNISCQYPFPLRNYITKEQIHLRIDKKREVKLLNSLNFMDLYPQK